MHRIFISLLLLLSCSYQLLVASETQTFEKKKKILTFSEPIVDHIIHLTEEQIKESLEANSNSRILSHQTVESMKENWREQIVSKIGGSGANTVKGLAALGNDCVLVGAIGDDPWGSFYSEEMKLRGVEVLAKQVSMPTAQVVSMVDPQGERIMCISRGASGEFSADDIQRSHFEGVDLVHFEGYHVLNFASIQKAMKMAKQAGCLVSLDLGNPGVVKTNKDKLTFLVKSYVDVLFGNTEEAAALSGVFSEENQAQLLSNWVTIAVVHNGSKGFWVANAQETQFFPACKVSKVVDCTGAGDVFTSGFLHAYLDKKSLDFCANLAAILGALVVQVEGGELPDYVWEKVVRSSLSEENLLVYKGETVNGIKQRV